MNFDLNEGQKQKKEDLAARLSQIFQDHPDLSEKDPEAVRKLLSLLAPLDYFFKTGTDPEQTRVSPFPETLTSVLLAQEMAQFSPAFCQALEMSTRLFGWVISRWGTEEQIQHFLIPIQQGRWLGAVGLSESLGNLPSRDMLTEGRKDGPGYLVNGSKPMVINAPLADGLGVIGKIDGQPAFFLLRSTTPGLQIGPPLATLGLDQVAMADLTLSHCPVAEEQIIGPFPDASILSEIQTRFNLIITTVSLGIMERALRGAQKVAGETSVNGKPLRANQEIGFKLAEMFTLFQTAQWMLYRAAWMLEAGEAEALTTLAAAKVFVTESAEEVTRSAMQIAAGQGFLSGNILESSFRDARLGPVAGDTSEVLRLRIAEDCLTKYKAGL
ncbi:MAG: acyl-CoA dehydrogenase [Thermodesulfobacteriota bacterium]